MWCGKQERKNYWEQASNNSNEKKDQNHHLFRHICWPFDSKGTTLNKKIFSLSFTYTPLHSTPFRFIPFGLVSKNFSLYCSNCCTYSCCCTCTMCNLCFWYNEIIRPKRYTQVRKQHTILLEAQTDLSRSSHITSSSSYSVNVWEWNRERVRT